VLPLVKGEVVQVGVEGRGRAAVVVLVALGAQVRVGAVRALAEGRAERGGVVREQAADVADKGLIRHEHDLDVHARAFAVELQLASLALVEQPSQIGQHICETRREDRIVLGLALFLVE